MYTMSQSPKKRMVFSLSPAIEKQLKAEVPARKRSELVEELLQKHFQSLTMKKSIKQIEKIRKKYKKKDDPVRLSAVEWIRKDRKKH